MKRPGSVGGATALLIAFYILNPFWSASQIPYDTLQVHLPRDFHQNISGDEVNSTRFHQLSKRWRINDQWSGMFQLLGFDDVDEKIKESMERTIIEAMLVMDAARKATEKTSSTPDWPRSVSDPIFERYFQNDESGDVAILVDNFIHMLTSQFSQMWLTPNDRPWNKECDAACPALLPLQIWYGGTHDPGHDCANGKVIAYNFADEERTWKRRLPSKYRRDYIVICPRFFDPDPDHHPFQFYRPRLRIDEDLLERPNNFASYAGEGGTAESDGGGMDLSASTLIHELLHNQMLGLASELVDNPAAEDGWERDRLYDRELSIPGWEYTVEANSAWRCQELKRRNQKPHLNVQNYVWYMLEHYWTTEMKVDASYWDDTPQSENDKEDTVKSYSMGRVSGPIPSVPLQIPARVPDTEIVIEPPAE